MRKLVGPTNEPTFTSMMSYLLFVVWLARAKEKNHVTLDDYSLRAVRTLIVVSLGSMRLLRRWNCGCRRASSSCREHGRSSRSGSAQHVSTVFVPTINRRSAGANRQCRCDDDDGTRHDGAATQHGRALSPVFLSSPSATLGTSTIRSSTMGPVVPFTPFVS